MNSTSNIRRRYNLLFTLPSKRVAVALSILSGLSLFLLSHSQIGYLLPSIAANIPFLSFLVSVTLLSVGSEIALLRSNPVATFRRLVMIATLSNFLWSVIASVGLAVSLATGSPHRFYSLMFFGMFSAIALRIIVFGSVFFSNIPSAVAVAFIQPTVQLFVLSFVDPLLFGISQPSVLALGLAFATSSALYLVTVNRSGKSMLRKPALELLRAFLQAWTENKAKLFEEIFEQESSPATVKTKVLTFGEGRQRPAVIVPEIHPGPFYPIGSSNIPYELQVWFSNNGYSPLVLHGVSGHDLNLPSRNMVDKFLSSLEDLRTIGVGNTCTVPISDSVGKATATGMLFGDFAFVIVTLAPHGTEDFPQLVKETIERKALEMGFRAAFVIDAHNSLGDIPSREDCESAIEAAGSVLRNSKNEQQHPFKIGNAHSSELQVTLKPDIGPAGIGVMLFEIMGTSYALISFDANNVHLGFRQKVLDHIKENVDVIEICTTDTHFNAAKVMNPHGYSALGELTQVGEIADILKELIKRAFSRMVQSDFKVSGVETEVKVVGEKLLDDFSVMLDKVTTTAKKGGISLVLIGALLFVLTTIL